MWRFLTQSVVITMSLRKVLLCLVIFMGLSLQNSVSAEESVWAHRGLRVGTFVKTCPATFGKKPIEVGTPEMAGGIACLSIVMSLLQHIEGAGRTCDAARMADDKRFQATYKKLLNKVKRAADRNPEDDFQKIAEPFLVEAFGCAGTR
jgi:hypothetical protein